MSALNSMGGPQWASTHLSHATPKDLWTKCEPQGIESP
jgi:hypothetical protein